MNNEICEALENYGCKKKTVATEKFLQYVKDDEWKKLSVSELLRNEDESFIGLTDEDKSDIEFRKWNYTQQVLDEIHTLVGAADDALDEVLDGSTFRDYGHQLRIYLAEILERLKLLHKATEIAHFAIYGKPQCGYHIDKNWED